MAKTTKRKQQKKQKKGASSNPSDLQKHIEKTRKITRGKTKGWNTISRLYQTFNGKFMDGTRECYYPFVHHSHRIWSGSSFQIGEFKPIRNFFRRYSNFEYDLTLIFTFIISICYLVFNNSKSKYSAIIHEMLDWIIFHSYILL